MRLLTDNERPIQMIFAGKAHPHDLAGKEIIKRLVHFSGDPRVASRIVFLEDYDMTMAALPRVGQRPVAEHAAPARWRRAARAA